MPTDDLYRRGCGKKAVWCHVTKHEATVYQLRRIPFPSGGNHEYPLIGVDSDWIEKWNEAIRRFDKAQMEVHSMVGDYFKEHWRLPSK